MNELVEAVRNGDLAAMTTIPDAHPELVNATTDIEQRVVPIELLSSG